LQGVGGVRIGSGQSTADGVEPPVMVPQQRLERRPVTSTSQRNEAGVFVLGDGPDITGRSRDRPGRRAPGADLKGR
jgi:hypothetical protein